MVVNTSTNGLDGEFKILVVCMYTYIFILVFPHFSFYSPLKCKERMLNCTPRYDMKTNLSIHPVLLMYDTSVHGYVKLLYRFTNETTKKQSHLHTLQNRPQILEQ